MYLGQADRIALQKRMAAALGADPTPAPPPAQTFPENAPTGPITAREALARLQIRYVQLATFGAKLKALGTNAPCAVRTAYNLAVKNYFLTGIDIFQQLGEQGVTIEQIVYKDGQPVRDPDGNAVAMTVTSPLLPPLLMLNDPLCPSLKQQGLAGFRGSLRGNGQLGQVPWALAVAAIQRAWPLIAFIGLTIATDVLLDKINVAIRGENTTPDRKVDAFISCIDQLQQKGLAPAAAVQQCGGIIPKPGAGIGVLGWIGIVALGVAGVGTAAYFVFRKTSTGERERSQRIHQAEADAERAAEEASQARARARAVRAGVPQPA